MHTHPLLTHLRPRAAASKRVRAQGERGTRRTRAPRFVNTYSAMKLGDETHRLRTIDETRGAALDDDKIKSINHAYAGHLRVLEAHG
eukprot:6190772-Pleurochrysis_carterae.AAC.1